LASWEGGTGLGEVYQAFDTPAQKYEPAIELSRGFGSIDGDSFHDAAFDAYCTGLAFARMASFIEKRMDKMDDGEFLTSSKAQWQSRF
jgi:hypothetical protein